MSLPDNRIRLSAPKIDFTNDVGETGQEHDTYPAAGQARYDWMRMFLIGLLSNQASYDEPINFRTGTLWLDLNTFSLKIRAGDGVAGSYWADFAAAVQVSDGLSLSQWFEAVSDSLANRIVSEEELRAAIGKFFVADISGNISSFIMASPSGHKYRITISDGGEFVKTLIP